MKRIRYIIKIVYGLGIGACCLVEILFYIGSITIDPLKYNFEIYHIYFYLTLILLPFFRISHRSWFVSADDYVSPRQKALEQHHEDIAKQHKGGRWSVSGVRVNPYEYTSPYTMSYDNSLNWVSSFVKSIFVSILFIIFAPLFYLASCFLHKRNEESL